MEILQKLEPPPRYSVVVPVYESSDSVDELVGRLVSVFRDVIDSTFEIILIDDGSINPETWLTLQKLDKDNVEVKSLKLMRNFGKAAAVLCGIQIAQGRWLVTIDDDLQQRPEDIPKLIEHEEHDVVVANFYSRKDSKLTIFTSWVKSIFDYMILKVPCRMSPLKLFKSEVAKGMLTIQTARPFIPAMMSYVTTDFVEVKVEHDVSKHGSSRYGFRRRFKQFLNLVIGNSSILLRFVAMIGVLTAISGFLYTLFIIYRKLFGVNIEPGWTSIMAMILIFGGANLIVLGIIGEYLIRILEGSSLKPAYIVRESNIHCNNNDSVYPESPDKE